MEKIWCEVLEVHGDCCKPEIVSLGFMDSVSQAVAWFKERGISFGSTRASLLSPDEQGRQDMIFTFVQPGDILRQRRVA